MTSTTGSSSHESKKKIRLILIVGSLVLILGIAGARFLWLTNHYESTDNAFIDGHIIQMSSKVPGQVLHVRVDDNQSVKEGDLLVQIDPIDYQVKLEQEKANLASALAEEKRAAQDAVRYTEIFQKDEISRQQLDNAVATDVKAKAAVERAQSAVKRAELDLAYTNIMTPESGTVTRKSVEEGVFVQTSQPLLAIVPDKVWVTANMKETQITRIKPGQGVTIEVDAYPGVTLHGHVDSVQRGTGERFSLMPPENASGNFVKVVQRVPVKILLDDADKAGVTLSPGMSVEPTIRIR